ncbi:MAG: hypothetical protein LBJ69_02145 [Holosporales bacterium]|nr:hypothetical protein [Holosporales bacterium]
MKKHIAILIAGISLATAAAEAMRVRWFQGTAARPQLGRTQPGKDTDAIVKGTRPQPGAPRWHGGTPSPIHDGSPVLMDAQSAYDAVRGGATPDDAKCPYIINLSRPGNGWGDAQNPVFNNPPPGRYRTLIFEMARSERTRPYIVVFTKDPRARAILVSIGEHDIITGLNLDNTHCLVPHKSSGKLCFLQQEQSDKNKHALRMTAESAIQRASRESPAPQ